MRIFSKQHDYYDGVAGYDSDPKRVFNRPEPEDKWDIEFKFNHVGKIYQSYDTVTRMYVEYFIIGFCGKIYPGIRFNGCINNHEYITEHFYDLDSIISLAENHETDFFDCRKKNEKYIKTWEDLQKQWGNWFNKINSDYFGTESFENKFDDIYLDHNVPYFKFSTDIGHKTYFTFYPNLKDHQFYRVFDAYQCYQKLDMFLFNELVPPDMIEHKVPDIIKAQSHGFNKFSFRKDKELI